MANRPRRRAGGARLFNAPLAFNPLVWQQYADAMANRPPSQWLSPTLGSLLRLAFGEELFRLQFVPMAVGLAWFAWNWRKTKDWDWREQLPLLMLVSFVTAPYGAWPFDMVLLLPAVVTVFVCWDRGRLGRKSVNQDAAETAAFPGKAIVGLIAVNVVCLVPLLKVSSFWFLWVSPAVLPLYVAGMRVRNPEVKVPGSPVPSARRRWQYEHDATRWRRSSCR